MAETDPKGATPGKIIAALIVVIGIIHLGVGAGIVSKYKKYHDVFRQPVGLSGFNIFIGLLAIATGAVCLVSIFMKRPALSKYFLYITIQTSIKEY